MRNVPQHISSNESCVSERIWVIQPDCISHPPLEITVAEKRSKEATGKQQKSQDLLKTGARSFLLVSACSDGHVRLRDFLLVILWMDDTLPGGLLTDIDICKTDDQPHDGNANCDQGVRLNCASARD
jgi:hypothetical protein